MSPSTSRAAPDQMVLRLAERTSLALQEYAATGDIKALLMVQRHLTFMSDENGDLPLHLAIIHKQRDVVKQLLSVMTTIPNSARKVNGINHMHQTPLHLAVLTQQTYVIDLLLKHGANPALVDRYGNTPAHLATKAGDEACVRALTKYLRPGVTQEKPFPELDLFNYEGVTPVHLAAASGSLKTLKAVCVRKANMNIQDGKSGRTPLHYAVEAADLPLVGYLLLEAGADPNSLTFDNNTPLHIACGRGLMGMVALLVASGANPDLENDDVPNDQESDDDTEQGDGLCRTPNDDDEESHRNGTKPRDLVSQHTKILRILDGEPYASIREIDEKMVTSPSAYLSQPTQDLMTYSSGTMESGIASYFGGLCYLDYPCRVRLARLLDPPGVDRDWRTLADKLGFHSYISSFEASPSPTKAVFEHLEFYDGTIEKLRETLVAMNRMDAVKVVDKAVEAYQEEIILNNSHSVNKTMPYFERVRPPVSAALATSGMSDLNYGP